MSICCEAPLTLTPVPPPPHQYLFPSLRVCILFTFTSNFCQISIRLFCFFPLPLSFNLFPVPFLPPFFFHFFLPCSFSPFPFLNPSLSLSRYLSLSSAIIRSDPLFPVRQMDDGREREREEMRHGVKRERRREKDRTDRDTLRRGGWIVTVRKTRLKMCSS